MKKRPVAQADDATYPSYEEYRKDRKRWLKLVALGAAALGASTVAGCDTINSLLGRDDGCDYPLPGVMVEVTPAPPPGDDDDSAEAATIGERETPAEPATPPPPVAKPDHHVRGKIKMPE